MDANHQQQESEPDTDVIVGRAAIRKFLIALGMPDTTDPYYLKKRGFPIGNIGSDRTTLIASKKRLSNFVAKLARGDAA
jgi:hypothetical protein